MVPVLTCLLLAAQVPAHKEAFAYRNNHEPHPKVVARLPAGQRTVGAEKARHFHHKRVFYRRIWMGHAASYLIY